MRRITLWGTGHGPLHTIHHLLEDTMHKLKLDLDQLTVDSFDTNPSESAPRGTVQAFGPTRIDPTCYVTCASCIMSCNTCDLSCGYTCGYTCGCGATGGYTCADPSCATCLTYCNQQSCVDYCS
jgi:hypothetical protein